MLRVETGGESGFVSRHTQRYSILHNVQIARWAHITTVQWVPGIKWPRREIDDSHAFSAEVKNSWSFRSLLRASSFHGA
jgi:hypothetical protein